MAKPVLGRDLGTLMGDKPAEKNARASAAPSGGAGMDSLLRGQRPADPEPPRQTSFPHAYLYVADILLVVLALITIYKSPRPIPLPVEIFCVATVALAALLALLAVWLGDQEPSGAARFSGKSGAGAGVMPNAVAPHKFRDEKTKPSHSQQ